MQAIHWAEGALTGRELWTEFDERLSSAFIIQSGGEKAGIVIKQYEALPSSRDLLISDVTRSRSLRLSRSLPVTFDSLVTYDNGQAQIFHLRPMTPYQR